MMKSLICCFPALRRIPHSIPTPSSWSHRKLPRNAALQPLQGLRPGPPTLC